MTLEESVAYAAEQTVRAGAVPFSKCSMVTLVYDFLMLVKNSEGCPWYVRIAIRQLHGALSSLRRKWQCP